jgi:hypothetical protein
MAINVTYLTALTRKAGTGGRKGIKWMNEDNERNVSPLNCNRCFH